MPLEKKTWSSTVNSKLKLFYFKKTSSKYLSFLGIVEAIFVQSKRPAVCCDSLVLVKGRFLMRFLTSFFWKHILDTLRDNGRRLLEVFGLLSPLSRACFVTRRLTTFNGLRFFLGTALTLNLILSSVAFAGSITANVDQLNFENGEEILLTVEVEGSLDQELSFPPSSDFKVSGTSKSTQVQIINGSYSKKNVYQFSLFSTKTGALNIPVIEAKIDGVIQKTIPIPITVGAQNRGAPSNRANSGSNGGSASASQGSTGAPQAPMNGASDASGQEMFVVERQVSPGPYYVHMPVVETIKILRRVDWQAASKSVDNTPNWQVYDVPGEQETIENRRGVNYRVLTLRRVLVPLKSGSLATPSWTLNVEFIDLNKRRSASPFDIFSQTPLSKRLIAAPEVSLSIAAIPEPDIPVGVLEPKVQLSQESVKVGDSVTLTFSVSGQGWFSGMGIPPPVLSGNFKSYQDQPSTKEDVSNDGLVGEKTIKVSIIPHEPGELVFPAWRFRYFDTKIGKISEKIVSIPKIQVTGQKEDLVIAGRGDPSSKKNKNSDLHSSHFHPPDFHYGNPYGLTYRQSDRVAVLGLFSVAGLVFLTAIFYVSRRRVLKGKNPEYLRSLQSWHRLRSRINRTTKQEELLQIFREYSASRIGSQENAITHRDITAVLAKDGWHGDLLDKITEFLIAEDAKKYGDKDVHISLPLDDIKKEVSKKKPCLDGSGMSTEVPL